MCAMLVLLLVGILSLQITFAGDNFSEHEDYVVSHWLHCSNVHSMANNVSKEKCNIQNMIEKRSGLVLSMNDEARTVIPVEVFQSILPFHLATQDSAFDPNVVYFEIQINCRVDINESSGISVEENIWNTIWKFSRLSFRILSSVHESHSTHFNFPLSKTSLLFPSHPFLSGILKRTVIWPVTQWNQSSFLAQQLSFRPAIILEGNSNEEITSFVKQLESSFQVTLYSVKVRYFPQPGKLQLDDVLNAEMLLSPYGGKKATHLVPVEIHEDPCILLGTSHAVLLQQIAIPKQREELFHTDKSNCTVSQWRLLQSLNHLPRILCIIYTTSSHHDRYISAQHGTWLRKCTSHLIISNQSDASINAVQLPFQGEESYANIWQKIRSVWKYVHAHYRQSYDWFLLGGDDLYVIMENMYSLLLSNGIQSKVINGEPVYLGRSLRFNTTNNSNTAPPTPNASAEYFSETEYAAKEAEEARYANGGSGYVLDRIALNVLVRRLLLLPGDPGECKASYRTSIEDALVGQCFYRAAFESTNHHYNNSTSSDSGRMDRINDKNWTADTCGSARESSASCEFDRKKDNASLSKSDEYDKRSLSTGNITRKLESFRQIANPIGVTDTRDIYGRERFHILPPGIVFTVNEDYLRKNHWMGHFTSYPFQNGSNCCSESSISFHYLHPFWMLAVDAFLYKCPRNRIAQYFQTHGKEHYTSHWLNTSSTFVV